MSASHLRLCLAAAAFAVIGVSVLPAAAQGAADSSAPPTREQVKMERSEFLATHRWDVASDQWVLKNNVQPPQGVRPREDVKAERDAFLRAHRWDNANSVWVPVAGQPRNLGTRSRAEVRAEAIAFTRSHRWDEGDDAWVPIAPPRTR